MHPTPLMTRFRKDFIQRRPETHCSVTDCQQWSGVQASFLQVQQQITPRFFGLTKAITDSDALLASIGFDADDDHQALFVGFLGTQPRINSVSPPIHILFARQIALIPCFPFVTPLLLQSADDGGRQPLGVFANQRLQSLTHVASRYALQVKPRQCRRHAL